MTPVIIAEELGKRFRTYPVDRPYTLQEAFLGGFRNLRQHTYFWALRDVSFELQSGKIIGVVGRNGAGKSTLLRLIGGVSQPDTGSVRVYGKIGALIDLGAGFHPELTGRENLMINAVISGLTRREAAQRMEAIFSFAEIESFADSPLRTYSSGMQMRLGFSIAVHTDPEVLLVDEVLAVGDAAFQKKCLERIDQIREQGCAILLVSHDTSLVNRLCDEALWLNEGEVTAHGPAEEVTGLYLAGIRSETEKRSPPGGQVPLPADSSLQLHENRIGSLEMEITGVRLLDVQYPVIRTLGSGQALNIELTYQARDRLASPIFTASVVRDDGLVCLDSSTQGIGMSLPDLVGSGKIILHLDRLALTPGQYSVDVGVFRHDWSYAYDYHWQVYPLEIIGPWGGKGVLAAAQHWEYLPSSEPGREGN